MKSWRVTGRVLCSRLLFAIFVVGIRGAAGMLFFMLLAQGSLTAGACRSIICDYLDHEKLLHGNYLRRG